MEPDANDVRPAQLGFLKRELYEGSRLKEPAPPWLKEFAAGVKVLVEQPGVRARFHGAIRDWSDARHAEYVRRLCGSGVVAGMPLPKGTDNGISWVGKDSGGNSLCPMADLPLIPFTPTRKITIGGKYVVVAAVHDYALSATTPWIGPDGWREHPYYAVHVQSYAPTLQPDHLLDLNDCLESVRSDLILDAQNCHRVPPRRRKSNLRGLSDIQLIASLEQEREKNPNLTLARAAEILGCDKSAISRRSNAGGAFAIWWNTGIREPATRHESCRRRSHRISAERIEERSGDEE